MTLCASCSSSATATLLEGSAQCVGGALLGLETSGPHGSMALWMPGAAAPTVRRWPARALPSEHLVPTLHTMLQSFDLRPGDLKALAVSRGPGSFTGIRVGLATAQGLSQGIEARLVGVSSLAILARTCGAPKVLTVLDARGGHVFAGLYKNEPHGALALKPDCQVPLAHLREALQGQLDAEGCVCVGDAPVVAAAVAHLGAATQKQQVVPCACAALVQAARHWATTAVGGQIKPHYLQNSAAESAREAQVFPDP